MNGDFDANAILRQQDHRTAPMPSRPWMQVQVWNDLLFAHWQVDPAVIRKAVPESLELDQYDGAAWVGMTPFLMTGVCLRDLPPLPGMSAFPELNVRTYVRLDGQPGIYFFSLDCTSILTVAGARGVYAFPYFYARMRHEPWGEGVRYSCRRVDVERLNPDYHGNCNWAGGERIEANFRGRYWPSGEIFQAQPGTIDHFLTERYCAYSTLCGRTYRTYIHHLPWTLQRAQAQIDVNTMGDADAIPLPDSAPHLMFSRRVEVLVWSPERVR